ncbi:MAG: SpoIIE family protein phosphatase, partial [Bacteroidia bacterium]|nr:SpoIIE family protein phosphatase [Bacteroidia bacterium]
DYVYFYSDINLFRFSKKETQVDYNWSTDFYKPFLGFIKMQDNLYINKYGEGLHKIDTVGLVPISNGQHFSAVKIVTGFHFNQNTFLVGTSDNNIYLFDDNEYRPYSFEAKDYLSEAVLSGGINLSDDQFVLSTLIGGCIFIDKNSGKTNNIVNYQTGLPDDGIHALGLDRNNGLWIAHDYGFSRLDNLIPVRNYSSYPGLKGNLTSVIDFDNTVYVGTSEGVFYLDKVKDYDDLRGYMKKPKPKRIVPTVIREEYIPDVEEEQKVDVAKKISPTEKDTLQKPKKKEFTLFGKKIKLSAKSRKKKKKEEEIAKQEEEQRLALIEEKQKEVTEEIKAPPKRVRVRQKVIAVQPEEPTDEEKQVYALRSIKYVFKKVKGLEGKCKQLVNFDPADSKKRLLVAGNSGLFEIVDQEANKIIDEPFVNCITVTGNANRFFVGLNSGLRSIYYDDDKWQVEDTTFEFINKSVYSIVEENGRDLWLGCENSIYKLTINSVGKPLLLISYPLYNEYSEILESRRIFNETYFIGSSVIYKYDQQKDSIIISSGLADYINEDSKVLYSNNDLLWSHNNDQWQGTDKFSNENIPGDMFLALFKNISGIFQDAEKNLWIIDEGNDLFKINHRESDSLFKQQFNIHIRNITDASEAALVFKDLTLDYENNSLAFNLIASYYISNESTIFQYKIDELDQEWLPWSEIPTFKFPFLPEGKYTIRFRAKNTLGVITPEATYSFTILPPYWKTWWFYLICGITGLSIVFVFIKIRERSLQKEKRVLEEKVNERTLQLKNEKEKVEKVNKKISESINYAQRIQETMLPTATHLQKVFPDSFIFYEAKDVVSGDFPWTLQNDNEFYISAVDCTGHGVPGAMLAMIGHFLLNDIVMAKKIHEPAKILDHLHDGIKETLRQEENIESRDGMDLAFCSINKSTGEVQYAGAHRPLYHLSNGNLTEFRGNRFPVGGLQYSKRGKEIKFINHKFKVQPGDSIYIFSDGLPDQIGGPDNKKFMSTRVQRLITENHQLSMKEMHKVFYDSFEVWKQDTKQLDDVLLIGIKF